MVRKILIFTSVLALILSACAQGSSAPQPSAQPSAYPPPQVLAPVVVSTIYPYPPEGLDTSSSNANTQKTPPSQNQVTAIGDNPYKPVAGDEALMRGKVYFEAKNGEVTMMINDPTQAVLHLVGTLPNPCYHLRAVVAKPDDKKQIMVEVYSVTDPNAICADMLQPFDALIPLGTYPSGKYSVYVNGSEFGVLGK